MRGFNDLSELAPEALEHLLALATRLEERPEPRALEGKVLALLFLSPSLRTSTSFQSAMMRLGGGSFVVSPDSGIHGLETRAGVTMDGVTAEHIREAIPVLASYGDALGVRAFAGKESLDDDVEDRDFRAMAELSPVPVINMESAIRHPCQSLADWKTMDDLDIPRAGGKFVLSWANHPKALPLAVPASTLQMAAMRGMDVTLLRPEGFELPEKVMAKARASASSAGGSIRETDDPREALAGASVVYAKAWSSTRHYGDDDAERELKKELHGWRVEESSFDGAARGCRFMHCLPVRRGVVVTDEVLEGPRSVVIHQARNRMWTQMAILYEILKEAS
ncbi:MAG: N-acetylornithine carbamoyltransferase [Acidobacteriota bacterium]|nr:MAG: N-acetylornithine carbamoyltransferase [Acidobacteriota bacterium]